MGLKEISFVIHNKHTGIQKTKSHIQYEYIVVNCARTPKLGHFIIPKYNCVIKLFTCQNVD